MDDANILQLLGQAGIGVGALIILARVVFKIGERMIAAIDRVGSKIDEHTKADTEALGALRQDVAVLNGRVEQALDWKERTPVETPTPRPLTRVAAGTTYSMGRRAPTRDEE